MTILSEAPRIPVFFLWTIGGGPFSGLAVIIEKEKIAQVARENMERAEREGRSAAAMDFHGLSQFVERAEVGALFLCERIVCFCMSGADAIYRLDKNVDPKDLPV